MLTCHGGQIDRHEAHGRLEVDDGNDVALAMGKVVQVHTAAVNRPMRVFRKLEKTTAAGEQF